MLIFDMQYFICFYIQEVTELEKEKLELLKLAMARNLARAVVHEGTQTT